MWSYSETKMTDCPGKAQSTKEGIAEESMAVGCK